MTSRPMRWVALAALVAATGAGGWTALATDPALAAAPGATSTTTATTGTGSGGGGPGSEEVVEGVAPTSAAARRAGTEYWTPERMRRAVSADAAGAAAVGASAATTRVVAAGKPEDPGNGEGKPPKATTPPQSGKSPKPSKPPKPSKSPKPTRPPKPGELPQQVEPVHGQLGPDTAGTPAQRTFLARTAGKVFFTQNGADYVCSATVVASPGQDTVWTAGHCVHAGAGGTWVQNWRFAPAYDGTLTPPTPFGLWTSAKLFTPSGWSKSSDYAADLGVAALRPLQGRHIVAYLGGQGFQVNQGRSVPEAVFGYPLERPYDGTTLQRCGGPSAPEWDTGHRPFAETLVVPCRLTRGASGGGWLHDFDGSAGYLNGVNSRIDQVTNPTAMMSPYFDNTAWTLYQRTRNR